MTTVQQKQQPAINLKAAGWTIAIHALLLLFFLLFKYTLPAQAPIEELGMEVNLGTSDDGSGDDQPMNTDAPAAIGIVNAGNSAATPTNNAKEIMHSDDPDAPAIAPVKAATTPVQHNTQTNANTRSTNPQRNNAPTTTPRQQPRFVYEGGNGAGGNNANTNAPGTSEGNTTGNGDRGVPGGTPGASNYVGSPGAGTGGISHTLSGREITPKKFEAEFNEGGKVVVKVTVDKAGNIVAKSIKSSPSRTLSNLAMQKLAQAKFSPNKDAAPQQFGEITIVFRSR